MMITSLIPDIQFDFNFDIILLILFSAYTVYGYFSGGHKQIRLSINLILPFVIIYYLGHTITEYLYIPLNNTFFFELINNFLSILKNTIGMIFTYIFTYVLLFSGVYILSKIAKRYLLNDNMKAKLGIKNNYLGAVFALINGYVLVYFLILPAFSINIIGSEARLTNFVLEHPPPFSRVGRTAEKAVPVKNLADKATTFQELISVDGIEGYYNDAISDYTALYVGSRDSYESKFMEEIYPNLTSVSQNKLHTEYNDYFDVDIDSNSFYGVSYILLKETNGKAIYQDILETESTFNETLKSKQLVVANYEQEVLEYDNLKANYDYQIALQNYNLDLDDYIDALKIYMINKTNALKLGQPFAETFLLDRPELTESKPEIEVTVDITEPPVDPDLNPSIEVTEALQYISDNEDKENVSDALEELALNFKNHEGLLIWYVEGLSEGQAVIPDTSDISTTIVSFKEYYTTITDNINDPELQEKLELAKMSIDTYDVFTIWLDCTKENIRNVSLDEIPNEENRCPAIDTSTVVSYDFTDEALSTVKTLFEGESVSYVISQYKYDYENGLFEDVLSDYKTIIDVLEDTKDMVDEYELYYKDIASSIDGNISMVIKIGISVMKYHLDIYDVLENTPILAAVFNDAARFCPGSSKVPGYDAEICYKTDGQSGTVKELMNMRYLVSEIYIKAYFMVDESNDVIMYDTLTMQEKIDAINDSINNHVVTKETVTAIADQFAFNPIDDDGTTLLEQMYEEGYITIEAMRLLAQDEYELFSSDFRSKVKSLIR